MHAGLGSSGFYPDIRKQFVRTDDPNLVGAGTLYAFGLTMAKLDRLFHQAKKFTIGGTLPGQQNTESFLLGYDLIGYPSDGLRQHLFAHRWRHYRNNGDSDGVPFFEAQPTGYLFDGKYYPFVNVFYFGREGEDEDEIVGTYTIQKTSYDPVGAVSMLGLTAPLYPTGEPDDHQNPPGGITLVAQEWTL